MKHLNLLLFGLLISMINYSQDNKVVQIENKDIIKKVKIYSEILNEYYTIWIRHPEGNFDSKKSYPLLFILDAEDKFDLTYGIYSSHARNGVIPQMLAIGIENNNRVRDFTPTNSQIGFLGMENLSLINSGGADSFIEFLELELIPYIDNNYYTEPYRVITGHSFAGLFSLYCLLKKPKLFNSYIVADGGLWFDNNVINKIALKSQIDTTENKQVFIGISSFSRHGKDAQLKFANIIDSLYPWINLEHELIKEGHGPCQTNALHIGFRKVFPDWWKCNCWLDIEGLKKHYQTRLFREYGFTPEISYDLIKFWGEYQLDQDKSKAIAIFEENVNLFPSKSDSYYYLAFAFYINGLSEKAIENIDLSLKIDPYNSKTLKLKEVIRK